MNETDVVGEMSRPPTPPVQSSMAAGKRQGRRSKKMVQIPETATDGGASLSSTRRMGKKNQNKETETEEASVRQTSRKRTAKARAKTGASTRKRDDDHLANKDRSDRDEVAPDNQVNKPRALDAGGKSVKRISAFAPRKRVPIPVSQPLSLCAFARAQGPSMPEARLTRDVKTITLAKPSDDANGAGSASRSAMLSPSILSVSSMSASSMSSGLASVSTSSPSAMGITASSPVGTSLAMVRVPLSLPSWARLLSTPVWATLLTQTNRSLYTTHAPLFGATVATIAHAAAAQTTRSMAMQTSSQTPVPRTLMAPTSLVPSLVPFSLPTPHGIPTPRGITQPNEPVADQCRVTPLASWTANEQQIQTPKEQHAPQEPDAGAARSRLQSRTNRTPR